MFGVCCNTQKYSMSVDLHNPKGQEVAKRLVAWADVVAESFTPGTMARWGLDYESCKKIKPDIIYFSTCQQGQWGPNANFGGYGMFAATMCGFAHVTGWPDRDPNYHVQQLHRLYLPLVPYHRRHRGASAPAQDRRRHVHGAGPV